MSFDVTSPDAAEMALQYAVDNKLKQALLNGKEVKLGEKKGSLRSLGELKAKGAADGFQLGKNALRLTVENTSRAERSPKPSPCGVYVLGAVVTGAAPAPEEPEKKRADLSGFSAVAAAAALHRHAPAESAAAALPRGTPTADLTTGVASWQVGRPSASPWPQL